MNANLRRLLYYIVRTVRGYNIVVQLVLWFNPRKQQSATQPLAHSSLLTTKAWWGGRESGGENLENLWVEVKTVERQWKGEARGGEERRGDERRGKARRGEERRRGEARWGEGHPFGHTLAIHSSDDLCLLNAVFIAQV